MPPKNLEQMNELNKKARNLRRNLTKQEWKLWNIIKNRQFYGFRFRRQFPLEPYIVDFICREKKIIIEIDGSQHNQTDNIEYDKNRTEFLNSRVIQLSDFGIMKLIIILRVFI